MQELIELQELDVEVNATEAEWTGICSNQISTKKFILLMDIIISINRIFVD